jgi:hypothetical protein
VTVPLSVVMPAVASAKSAVVVSSATTVTSRVCVTKPNFETDSV